MAAALSRTARRLFLPSKLLPSFTYSTTPPLQPNSDSPFPSFRAAKSAILSQSDPDKLAQSFIQYSDLPAFRRHRPIYHYSIRKLARAQRFDLIDGIIQSQLKPPSAISEGFWIRLIMLYSSSGMVDQAIRTLDQVILNKPCDLSEKSLCAVLSVYLNNSMPEKVHEMFRTIPEKIGVTPTVVSHNLALKAFVQQNDLELARNLIDELYKDDAKVVPNIDSYNILLGAYWNKGDLVGFDGIVKEISKRGLEFNLATYNYRILRLCKNKECARAKKLLDEMVSKGVKPNSSSYDAIIYGYGNVGDIELATKVLKSMLEDGHVSLSSRIYYSLIRSMVKEGEFTCREIIKRRWVPPFEAMEGLVRGLVGISKVEEAKEVVEKMKKMLKGPAVDSWGKIEAALSL
ncbi:pentatricopeptide repeat-containing protein At1g61870, mitochondrial-like isoform X2 [Cucurbita maxima]|uniref:Pentatricopeptide repeat-containing protein At1g61870, mitochondrial-like isoform X2 n=1 Tax=Cucurbita maxima TaxID=3661 RepID=A0A6J1J6X0_CUCMA|nr:pentatricopeptide repeat-containing protein At1g61870, mitochondrial-like isoform X2 [Cucurbita maxima]